MPAPRAISAPRAKKSRYDSNALTATSFLVVSLEAIAAAGWTVWTRALARVLVEVLLVGTRGHATTEATARDVIKLLMPRAEGQPIGRTLTLARCWIVNLAPGTLAIGHVRTEARIGRVVEYLHPRTGRWSVETFALARLWVETFIFRTLRSLFTLTATCFEV